MDPLLERKARAEQELRTLEARAAGQPSFELAPSLQNEIRVLEEELRLLGEATGTPGEPRRMRARDNPFVGLVPFEESDRERYFGRTRPARDLFELATRGLRPGCALATKPLLAREWQRICTLGLRAILCVAAIAARCARSLRDGDGFDQHAVGAG